HVVILQRRQAQRRQAQPLGLLDDDGQRVHEAALRAVEVLGFTKVILRLHHQTSTTIYTNEIGVVASRALACNGRGVRRRRTR
ncbi:hypothetical protein ABTF85_19425, partial [Acinetobacter baumannii]